MFDVAGHPELEVDVTGWRPAHSRRNKSLGHGGGTPVAAGRTAEAGFPEDLSTRPAGWVPGDP